MPHKDPEVAKTYQAKYRAMCEERDGSPRSTGWYRKLPQTDKEVLNRKELARRWDRYFGWDRGTYDRLVSTTKECAVCGHPFGETRKLTPVIDHCHKTKRFRGLIHHRCNLALAFLEDNEQTCYRAAIYIRTIRMQKEIPWQNSTLLSSDPKDFFTLQHSMR